MSALQELQQALRTVEDQLELAHGRLNRSRTALHEAKAALTRLDPDHPETVVPPGLHRADDQVERTLAALEQVSCTVRDFAGRL